jgi:FtsP/CotA-like multicopper oxidase with cupredoxin domain
MNRTRRNILLATAGAAAVAGAGLTRHTLLPHAQASTRQPLWIPPLLDARDQGQALSLNAQRSTKEFFPGKRSITLGYNGSYLGPTLRVHRGDDVQVAVSNNLDEETTVHWHGLLIPGDRDGGPHQTIAPGGTWRTLLPVRQAGATLFYHSHVHGRTAEQVYAGLAGVLLVHDPREDHLGLPAQYGVDDLPLVIQDRQFDDGTLVMPGGMMALMHGRLGGTLLVNGTPDAEVRVPARRVRLGLVNGSNARIYELSFGDRRAFQWIASEGGLLAAPVALRSLTLAPGERAEILVDFSDGRAASLLPGRVDNRMMMGPMGRMGGMGARAPAPQAIRCCCRSSRPGQRQPARHFRHASPLCAARMPVAVRGAAISASTCPWRG